MADHEAESSSKSIISPKVAAAAISGAGASILFAMLTAITPDLLEPIGPWASVVGAGITATAAVVAGYMKADPLRK